MTPSLTMTSPSTISKLDTQPQPADAASFGVKCSNLAMWDCESGGGPSSPSSADTPDIWERQKLGVVVQTEKRCRKALPLRCEAESCS